ncbi:MAG: threonine-phosphate decarboxylase [Candidatus Omnitrophica bacterium]|nr:threonine-phosphate decarboxylase [Candidatus Omnitrophota bacterium]
MGVLNFSHGGNLYEEEKKYGRSLIDFSANINPLGIPEGLKKKLFSEFEKILNYPDSDSSRVIQKLADYWRIKKSNVLLGNGSAELIYLITNAYKPRTAVIPVPTFSEYERALRLVKSKIIFLPLKERNKFCLDAPKLKNKPDICFVCNPNNPTGNLLIKNRENIGIKTNKLLVIDEAFMDFLPRQEDHTFIREAVKDKKIIVMRSFTKFFALPGLRIGYLVAHRSVIEKLKRYKFPWNVNSPAQIAAIEVLNDKKFSLKTYEKIKEERDFLLRNLARFKSLKCFPSNANFILIKIKTNKQSSESLKMKLVKRGVLIRSCSNFRALNDRYIRIAVRTRRENLKLINALQEII